MENHDTHQPPRHRETMLTLVLTGLAAAAILLFLILISGGFFFFVVVAVAAITGLGFFHYLLWGYAMTQDVADEQARDLPAPEEAEQDLDLLRDRIRRPRF
jgi:hypothetical protein